MSSPLNGIGTAIKLDAFRLLPPQLQQLLIKAASVDLDEDWTLSIEPRPLDREMVLFCIRFQHAEEQRGAEWSNCGEPGDEHWRCVLSSADSTISAEQGSMEKRSTLN